MKRKHNAIREYDRKKLLWMKLAMQKARGGNSRKSKYTDIKGIKADGKELRGNTM